MSSSSHQIKRDFTHHGTNNDKVHRSSKARASSKKMIPQAKGIMQRRTTNYANANIIQTAQSLENDANATTATTTATNTTKNTNKNTNTNNYELTPWIDQGYIDTNNVLLLADPEQTMFHTQPESFGESMDEFLALATQCPMRAYDSSNSNLDSKKHQNNIVGMSVMNGGPGRMDVKVRYKIKNGVKSLTQILITRLQQQQGS